MLIHLRLLGPPAIAGDSATPQWEPLERKDAAWLALLALEGPSARERIVSWLWPDAAPKTAAGSLRQRIFRLRRKLGHELVRAAETVALLPDVICDVAPVAEAAPGESAAAPATPLLATLEYADCPEFAQWLQRQRELRHRRWFDSLAAAASRLEESGELAAALELAQQLLTTEPLSEYAARRVMRMHYLRGDRAAALTVFERFERVLKDELGTRPGHETLQLLTTIERAESRPGAVVAGAAGPTVFAPTANAPDLRSATTLPRRMPVPTSLKRPPLLVGRGRELAALHGAWGAGRLFIVQGEAGMGKTRLLEEFSAGRPGALKVQARPGDAGVPFALLARLLRALRERCDIATDEPTRRELARVLPELGASAPTAGEGQRLLLQRALERVLLQAAAAPEREARPAVEAAPAAFAERVPVAELLLDDLHFADNASLETLQALAGSERLASLRWGLAKRPVEGGAAAQALRDVLAESQRLHEVMLGPLDVSALRELIESLGLPEMDAATLAAPLLRHTGGNPLFVLETLKDMVLQGAAGKHLPQPATVGTLIERRLRTLGSAALSLARVAAIAGVDFGIDLASAVLKTPALALADAWAELEAAQVLSGSAFAHDLVFDAVARGVPAEIARHVHADVAEVLQRAQAEPARVGAHWEAAARPADAAAQFERAAAHTCDAGRLVEARELWQRAARLHAAAGQHDRRWRCELRSVDIVAFTVGAQAACELAERLHAQAATDRERVEAGAALAFCTSLAGKWKETVEIADGVDGAAERLGRPEWAVAAWAPRASALSQLGRAGEAIEHLERTRPLAERAGTALQRYAHLSAIAYAQNLADRPRAALTTLNECAALAREMGNLSEVMNCLNNSAVVFTFTGQVREARARCRAALALVQTAGLGQGAQPATAHMNYGALSGAIGEYREALTTLTRAAAEFATTGPMWEVTARHHLATLWLHLGQWHRAAAQLTGADAGLPVSTLCRRITLRARLARLRRDAPAATLAASLRAEYARLSRTANSRTLFGLVLELTRLVEASEGAALTRQVREHALNIGHRGVALHALMREADLLRTTDTAEALRLGGEIERFDDDVLPSDAHLPELWLVLAKLWEGIDATKMQAFVQRGVHWVRRATERELEPAQRAAFLERNPINRELLEWGRRLGMAGT